MRRLLCVPLLLTLIAYIIVPVLAATTNQVWVKNDFEEAHWTKEVGFAIFYENEKITLIPPSTNGTKIWYYKTLDQLNNGTYPTEVYIYVKYNVTYTSTENEDQIFNVHLKGAGGRVYDIGFGRWNSTTFYFLIRESINGTEKKVFVSSLPSEAVVYYDGQFLIFFDGDGEVITTIETSESTWDTGGGFKEFGFGVWRTDHTDILAYCVGNSLDAVLTGYLSGETTEIINAFVPVIVAVAMLSFSLAMVKKFGG